MLRWHELATPSEGMQPFRQNIVVPATQHESQVSSRAMTAVRVLFRLARRRLRRPAHHRLPAHTFVCSQEGRCTEERLLCFTSLAQLWQQGTECAAQAGQGGRATLRAEQRYCHEGIPGFGYLTVVLHISCAFTLT
jgi:hypothetical protein